MIDDGTPPGLTESPLRESLARRSLFTFALQVVLRLRGFIVVPVLTRVLTPGELGVISLGSALAAGLTPLLLLGMHTGLSLQLVRLEGARVRPALLSVFAFSFVYAVALTAILLGAASTGIFGPGFAPVLPVLVPVGIFAVGLALREVSLVLPLVRQKLRFISRISLFMDFGGLVASLALVSSFGAWGVLLGVGSLSLIGGLIAIGYSLAVTEGEWTVDMEFLRATMQTALPVVPLAVSLWALQSSDYFFVSHFRQAADVAIYGLAYNLASPALMAIAALNLTYLPTCIEILGQGRVAFARFMDRSSILFAVGGVAAVAFATAAGPSFAAWFGGPLYRESGRLLPIVVAAYVFFSLSQLQQFIPGAMSRDMSASARAHVWAASLNLAANLVVVPRFGLWGAAWSTLGAYALALVLLSRSIRQEFGELAWPRQAGRLGALALVSTGAACLLQGAAGNVLVGLLFGCLAAALAIGLAFAGRLVRREDLAFVRPSGLDRR